MKIKKNLIIDRWELLEKYLDQENKNDNVDKSDIKNVVLY